LEEYMSSLRFLPVAGATAIAVAVAVALVPVLGLDGLDAAQLTVPEVSSPARLVAAGQEAAQEPAFFVSTTARLAYEDTHCDPGEPCPLGSALIRAQDELGEVRACYDPEDVNWGAPCPEGALPLRTSDPGYDAESGKWVFQMSTDEH
jgi:hypothetical protein